MARRPRRPRSRPDTSVPIAIDRQRRDAGRSAGVGGRCTGGRADVEDAAAGVDVEEMTTRRQRLRPRSGLTVPGTVKSYTPITDRHARASSRRRLADALSRLLGLEQQPAHADYAEERGPPSVEVGVAARRRHATADYAARARRRDVPVDEHDQHGPGAGRTDGRPDLGASTGTDRDGRSERDADDGAVRQPGVLSGDRRHACTRSTPAAGTSCGRPRCPSTPTTRSGES